MYVRYQTQAQRPQAIGKGGLKKAHSYPETGLNMWSTSVTGDNSLVNKTSFSSLTWKKDLACHLKTHMRVNVAHCSTRGWKRLVNKKQVGDNREDKLLDEASQRWTKQTDGEEDVKEHSVSNSLPVFTVSKLTRVRTGSTPQWSSWLLMLILSLTHTHNHSVRPVSSIREQCLIWQLRSDKKVYEASSFIPERREWGEPVFSGCCLFSNMNHRTPTIKPTIYLMSRVHQKIPRTVSHGIKYS